MRNSPNFGVLNEPRGFIKILEVLLAIFAFSCATGYRGHIEVIQEFGAGSPYSAKTTFSYPFDTKVDLPLKYNDTITNLELIFNQRSSSEFFVVIGVFCFLYCLIILVYYVMFEEENAQSSTATGMLSLPVIDFCVGAFWALFWFFSACAFASATNGIKKAADIEKSVHMLDACINGNKCTFIGAKYAALTIAILLGFLNVFVWSGNMWFLWKETPWHTANRRNQPATLGGQSHQSAPAAPI